MQISKLIKANGGKVVFSINDGTVLVTTREQYEAAKSANVKKAIAKKNEIVDAEVVTYLFVL